MSDAAAQQGAPDVADLKTKEVRQLLKRHNVDVRGCLERSDFLAAWTAFLVNGGEYVDESSNGAEGAGKALPLWCASLDHWYTRRVCLQLLG